MDKRQLINKIIDILEVERKKLAEAALNTYNAATHEESEAEDQYDTRGLEASYLAGAQAKRVVEIEQFILNLRFIEPKNFAADAPVSATALVEVVHDDKTSWCFLLPKGGGMSVEFDGHPVQIITPKSPIGEALMGRRAGDLAIVDTGKETREYEIISVR